MKTIPDQLLIDNLHKLPIVDDFKKSKSKEPKKYTGPVKTGTVDKDGNYHPGYMERVYLPLSKDISHKKYKRLLRAKENGGNVRAIMKRVG